MASLMAVVAAFAITFSALGSESDIWANTIFTGVVFVFVAAGICAWHADNKMRRAFWIGFLVLGCGYAFLAFGPGALRDKLVGTAMANYLQPKLLRQLNAQAPICHARRNGRRIHGGNGRWPRYNLYR